MCEGYPFEVISEGLWLFKAEHPLVFQASVSVEKSWSSIGTGQAAQVSVFSQLRLSFSFKKINSRGARKV